MIRQDYLIRQIEQAAVVLARISGLLKDGEAELAGRDAGESVESLTGMKVSDLLLASPASLQAALMKDCPTALLPEKRALLAGLLDRMAESHDLAHEDQESVAEDGFPTACRLRALEMLLDNVLSGDDMAVTRHIITLRRLRQEIPDEEMPPPMLAALITFQERIGDPNVARTELNLLEQKAGDQQEARLFIEAARRRLG